MVTNGRLAGEALTTAISAAVAHLYHKFYGHDRTTAKTYIILSANQTIPGCACELFFLEHDAVADDWPEPER